MRNIQVFGRRLGALFLFTTILYAELPPLPANNTVPPAGQIQLVPAQQAPAPNPAPNGYTMQGTPRHGAPAADYNTATRDAALAKCEHLKEVDFKGFKQCFQIEMRKSSNEIKRRFRETEARQGQPFRNVGPDDSSLDAPVKNPAFDADVQRE